jgi:DNA-binding CsgD family transcriptional regulator
MSKFTNIARRFIDECWHANFNPACITEVLSKNCLHQKTIGKCVGIESFTTDCYDWSASFPDYSTEIKRVEEYRNVVICDIDRKGSHLCRYQSTNPNKKSILSISDFFKNIENLEATGVQYSQPAKVIFAFEKEKISQIIIEEDPYKMSLQLGLPISKEPIPHRDYSLEMRLLAQALDHTIHKTLSGREMECLALGFCGFSAKHIGELLGISYRTVEFFLQSCYQKLNCRGKQQALELMYESHLFILWLDLGKSIVIRKTEYVH